MLSDVMGIVYCRAAIDDGSTASAAAAVAFLFKCGHFFMCVC